MHVVFKRMQTIHNGTFSKCFFSIQCFNEDKKYCHHCFLHTQKEYKQEYTFLMQVHVKKHIKKVGEYLYGKRDC